MRRGADAWPGLLLSSEVFLSWIGQRVQADVSSVAQLEIEDLYLACACAVGLPRALETFDRVILPRAEVTIRRYDSNDKFVDEVRQALREKLFLPPAKIAEFNGRGRLVAWLRAAAARTALNHLRSRPAPLSRAVDLDLLPDVSADPALALLKVHHRGAFREAFKEALATLTPRERTTLRLSALDGLTLEKIGAMYGKDKSTVSRWVTTAQHKLLKGTQTRLGRLLQLSGESLESFVRALSSQLESSLVELLADD